MPEKKINKPGAFKKLGVGGTKKDFKLKGIANPEARILRSKRDVTKLEKRSKPELRGGVDEREWNKKLQKWLRQSNKQLKKSENPEARK